MSWLWSFGSRRKQSNASDGLEDVPDVENDESQLHSDTRDPFYIPEVVDIITEPPRTSPPRFLPGNFPSEDPEPGTGTSRTDPGKDLCAVAQSVVFWLLACQSCRDSSRTKQTKKEAEQYVDRIKDRWKHEKEKIENLPGIRGRSLSRAHGTSDSNSRPTSEKRRDSDFRQSMLQRQNTNEPDVSSIVSTTKKLTKAERKAFRSQSVPVTVTPRIDAMLQPDLEKVRDNLNSMMNPPPIVRRCVDRQQPRVTCAQATPSTRSRSTTMSNTSIQRPVSKTASKIVKPSKPIPFEILSSPTASTSELKHTEAETVEPKAQIEQIDGANDSEPSRDGLDANDNSLAQISNPNQLLRQPKRVYLTAEGHVGFNMDDSKDSLTENPSVTPTSRSRSMSPARYSHTPASSYQDFKHVFAAKRVIRRSHSTSRLPASSIISISSDNDTLKAYVVDNNSFANPPHRTDLRPPYSP